jgi:hypothetical protein
MASWLHATEGNSCHLPGSESAAHDFRWVYAPPNRTRCICSPFRLAPPPLPTKPAAAMNAIRSALARARSAPRLRSPRAPRARRYAAVGDTQPERVAAEMVRYALGGAGRQSSSG